MVNGKRVLAVALMLFACLLLSACRTPRQITIKTAEVAQNRTIPDTIQNLAIMPFENKSGKPGLEDRMRSSIMTKLQESGRYNFAVRDDMMKTLEAENMLSSAGMTKEALEDDRFEKVDAFVRGTVTSYTWDYTTQTRIRQETRSRTKMVMTSSGYPSTSIEYFTVDVPYQVAMVSAGVAGTLELVDRSGKVWETKAVNKTFGGEFELGKQQPPAEESQMAALIEMAVEEFRRRIAPWVKVETYELLGGGGLDQGRQWAQSGLYDMAIDFFKNGATQNPDDPEWIYNLGLCYEAMGDYEIALESYKNALMMEGQNQAFINAVGRIKTKIARRDAGEIRPMVPASGASS
ncbi:MAG: tetratricopeptide repeat protein [Planctomycetota bacterium]|jgi:tetratricopeptide (TPR) repeat protein